MKPVRRKSVRVAAASVVAAAAAATVAVDAAVAAVAAAAVVEIAVAVATIAPVTKIPLSHKIRRQVLPDAGFFYFGIKTRWCSTGPGRSGVGVTSSQA